MRKLSRNRAVGCALLAIAGQLYPSARAQNAIQVNGYSDIILYDKPVAFFRFEETSGSVATNSVPGGLNGAYYVGDEANPGDGGSPSNAQGATGPRPPDFMGFAADNKSATFGGSATQDWVDAKKQYLQHLGAFSLEYWVKPSIRVSDPTTFGTRIGIVGQNDACEYGFIDQNNIQIWTPGGSLNTAYTFPDNEWHHVATIADGSTIKTYYDGVEVGSANAASSDYGSSTYTVHIGGGGVFDAAGNYFTGNIDEVAIFNKAIPASRIAQHYAAAKNGGTFTVPFINDPLGTTSGFTIGVPDVGAHVPDTNSIVLKLDGVAVTPTSVAKDTNGVTTIAYASSTGPLVSGSKHTTSLAIKDTGGASYSSDGSFTVPTYATLDPSFAVTGVDTSKLGFRVKPYQVDVPDQPNTIAWTEEMFAGFHGANIADTTQVIDGKPIGSDGYWTYTDVINWDEVSTAATDGNFNNNNGYPDIEIPGQPGTTGVYDNCAEEVLTFLQFPTGGQFYTMGVNSDDGFRVSAGPNLRDAFQGLLLGEYNVSGGRGSSDSIFKFYVPQAGIYPMRLLWENGGGGANCEWFTVQPDGTKVLLNDPSSTNTTGIKAYYSGPAQANPPYVIGFTPRLLSGTLSIADGATQVTPSSVQVQLNGATIPVTATKTNGVTSVSYTMSSALPPGTTATLALSFQDSTSVTFTNGTTFVAGSYTGVTKDTIKGYAGYIRGGTGGFTADGGGHSGAKGDYAIDTSKTGGTWVDIEDVSFLNAAAPADKLSVSFWIKKYDIVAGSAFWGQLSQVTDGTDLRGFQAHVPWSDDNIYFDTAGCCDTALQRISANINTFDPYNTVGSDAYWTNWHHFVFTKNADQKNIYIDGQLFLNGSSTDPLLPNFTALGLLTDGVPGGDFMHGVIDDFAVYASEVTPADATKLASGTSPKDLTGENLVAYWDFNDYSAPAAGGQPAELGQTVNGFQDDFTGANRDPNWVAVGPGGDHYVQNNGVLQVSASHGDPNHLLYMGPGASNSVQEILARMRVVAFGSGDPDRGGVAVGVITNLPGHLTDWSGVNINFRNHNGDLTGPNYHLRMLDDLRAWGPQLNTGWTNNVWYWMRLRVDPKADGTNDYFGKVWVADGTTAEPGDWQMKWPDKGTGAATTPLHSGYAGITGCSADGLAQLEVDYVLIKAATLPSITVDFAPQGPAVNPPDLMGISLSGKNAIINWFGGTLQSGTNVAGPWADVANAPSPRTNAVGTAVGGHFYRVRQ